MPIVRISRGWFEAHQHDEVSRLLSEGANTLIPAIQKLPGLLNYYVGIDGVTNSMTNVSIWESEEAAQQMATLAEMAVQRDVFIALGVRFDAIANYAPLWKIAA